VEPTGKAHAFVVDIEVPVLEDPDRHHIDQVLRVRTGDEITVTDGEGRWRVCRFGNRLDPVGPIETEPAPDPEITIAFALVKGERPELVVQKLTEIGVDRIVPFVADRTVVRWDADKRRRNATRLAVVAREAAMQSRRTRLPVIEPVAEFADLSARLGAARADRGGAAPSLARPMLLIGPEGGWSDDERAAMPESVGLGPTVLRAETAAIVAAAALCGLRSARSESVDGHAG
jgi:16S rRNA (uracil1498-N3)-methyltransferase